MAVRVNKDVTTPESTGAVEFDGAPVTTEQLADASSTGAVEYVAPGETKVEHYGAEVVVNYPTPSEPVTVTVGWLAEAQTKVVEPSEPAEPQASDVTVETKDADPQPESA
jgi:hypothetical protein